jgi:hypothetical protein
MLRVTTRTVYPDVVSPARGSTPALSSGNLVMIHGCYLARVRTRVQGTGLNIVPVLLARMPW